MKASSAELRDLLATRQFYMADLFTFTFVGGDVLRYCAGDTDITVSSNVYNAGGITGPYMEARDGNGNRCHWKVGLAVDTMTLTILPGSATIFGATWLSAVQSGVFDGCKVTMSTAIMSVYGNVTPGVVTMFTGYVGEPTADDQKITFPINSTLELLNIQLPRNLFQAGCVNNLGDASCGVNLASFSESSTVLVNSTKSTIKANLAAAIEYFDQGKIVFSSGDNDGVARTVKSWENTPPGTIKLISPLPSTPSVGDSFTIYAGCDKTLTGGNGCTKFSNTARYRGFDFIPVPETAV